MHRSNGPARLAELVIANAGLVLHKYLLAKFQKGDWTDKRVLELGSGTGVVGLAAAVLGGQVTLTDLQDKIELVELNVTTNSEYYVSIPAVMPLGIPAFL